MEISNGTYVFLVLLVWSGRISLTPPLQRCDFLEKCSHFVFIISESQKQHGTTHPHNTVFSLPRRHVNNKTTAFIIDNILLWKATMFLNLTRKRNFADLKNDESSLLALLMWSLVKKVPDDYGSGKKDQPLSAGEERRKHLNNVQWFLLSL